MNAPGKTLLKVSGIILVVFGAFFLITTAIGFFGYSAMDNPEVIQALEQSGTPAVDKGQMLFGLIIMLISAVIWLVPGIIGIKNCNNQSKAQICFILGAVMVVFELANAIYGTVTGSFNVFSVILRLILPLLYTWGAMKNKQDSQQGEI